METTDPMIGIILVASATALVALGFAIYFWFQDKQEEKAKRQIQKQ